MRVPKIGRWYKPVDELGTAVLVLGIKERDGVKWVSCRYRGAPNPIPPMTVDEFYLEFK